MISVSSHAEGQAMGTSYARACAAGRAQQATWRQEQAGLNREWSEIQTIPTKRLLPNLHFNGSERNYNLNLMILSLYLIHLAMIVGRYCAWEGVFVKAERFAYDTKMRYWTASCINEKSFYVVSNEL